MYANGPPVVGRGTTTGVAAVAEWARPVNTSAQTNTGTRTRATRIPWRVSAGCSSLDSLVRVRLAERKRALQCRAGGKNERISAGRPRELNRRRKPVFGRAARQGEPRPPGQVEGGGQPGQHCARALAVVRRDGRQRGGQEQIELAERVVQLLPHAFAEPPRCLDLGVAQLDRPLERGPDVVPVVLGALGEEAGV